MKKPFVDARREVSRQEIIAVATAEFARNGVRSTSMSQLASALSLTKPAIYHYFGSKRELVLATVNENIAQVRAAVFGDLPEEESAEAALRALIDLKLRQVEREGPVPLLFFYTVMLENLDEPEVEARFREFWEQGREAAAELIRRGQAQGIFSPNVDLDAFLDTFQGTFVGIDILWLTSKKGMDLRTAYSVAMDQVIATLKG